MVAGDLVDAKYIFVDVVEYAVGRSVEAQGEITAALNAIIRSTVEEFGASKECVLFLPAGDGVCVALLNLYQPFDLHMQIALSILGRVHRLSEMTDDVMRQFSIRVGINENTDNLVTDINGNLNIAGSGINYAQRVMSVGDPKNLMVSEATYNRLSQREKYRDKFTKYTATVKHGEEIPVYLFCDASAEYVDALPPWHLAGTSDMTEAVLSSPASHYFALVHKHAQFIKDNFKNWRTGECLQVLMCMLVTDSINAIHEPLGSRTTVLPVAGNLKASFEQLLTLPMQIVRQLGKLYLEKYLDPLARRFLKGSDKLVVTEIGLRELFEQYPEIAKYHEIERTEPAPKEEADVPF